MFKKHWLDLVIIFSVITISLTAFLILHFTGSKENLLAEIYYKSNIVEVVNLEKENEQRIIEVQGLHGKVYVAVKHNAVAVIESSCPEKICVNTGWVDKSNHQIVCAYNQVYVLVKGGTPSVDIQV